MLRDWRGEPCIVVNTFETSQASFQVNGRLVTINQTSDFPIRGRSTIRIASEKWQKIGVMIRNPKWATGVEVSGSLKYTISSAPDEARNYSEFSDWFFIAPKTWASKKVEMTYGIHPALIIGSGINTGHVAWTYGPFVLAYNAQLGGISAKAEKIWPTTDKQPLHFQVPVVRYGLALNLSLVPFADIGAKGERYKVWLPTASSGATSLFSGATESRSQSGNADGSIVDDDPGTYAVTFNGKPQDEAWFSVTVPTPVEIQRITFTQGPLFHDGGWFDTSKGKPIVQVQTVPNGPWITVGSLDYYPSTTASSHAGLKGGEQFTFALPAKQKVVGICVSGTPAGGDNPNQAFASCAELQAFRP